MTSTKVFVGEGMLTCLLPRHLALAHAWYEILSLDSSGNARCCMLSPLFILVKHDLLGSLKTKGLTANSNYKKQ